MRTLLLCYLLLACAPHSYFQAIGPTYPALTTPVIGIPSQYRYKLNKQNGQLLGLLHGEKISTADVAKHGGNYYVIIGDVVEVWRVDDSK